MAFIPTKNTSQVAKKSLIEPNIVLEIEGLPVIFGSQETLTKWKFDDGFFFDEGLSFDTPVKDPNARDYISLEGTSASISQQVLPDRGGTSSSLTMNINIIDYKGEVTDLFTSGNYIDDLLGARASVYVGFKQLAHPDHSIPIMDGFIQSINPGHGNYTITVSHAEIKKRQDIFEVYTSTLTADIDGVTTTIPVASTRDLIESSDALTSHIKISDEIMEVVSVDSATQLTVIRERLGTLQSAHTIDSDISSVYCLDGNAIDLALKLYLSGGDEFYQTLTATNFINLGDGSFLNDSIYFEGINLTNLNITLGDSITIANAINPGNDGTYIITALGSTSSGSYLTCAGAGFILEVASTATLQFKSKYNVLNEGCGLTPFDVDIATHEAEFSQNSASLPTYSFCLDSEITAKDFIDSQLYFPSGLYSINRSAKISCKFTRPPLASEGSKTFNSSNIIDIDKIKPTRSTAKFLYNSVVYKYDKAVLDGEYKAGVINVNPEAKDRIDKVLHTLKVESDGLTRTGGTTNLIERQTQRFYQRYQYGATLYKGVKVLFKDAFTLEIGDVVKFGGTDVLIPDIHAGTSYTPIKYLEIISKSQNLIDGVISFDLLETGFDLSARYAVISPSSYITSNSTTSKLELELSFYTGQVVTEREKWEQYQGQRIRVRSEDYTFDEIVTISSFDNQKDEAINITPPLSMAPIAGWLVEIPQYDESDASIDEVYKQTYTYNNLEETITAVTDDKTFDVANPSQYESGMFIQVRSQDYTNNTGDFGVEIDTVIGSTITLLEDLTFTPIIGDAIIKLNWKDSGLAYRFI